MLFTGFSDVIGSWKIIAIFVPRMSRISLADALRISWPSSSTEPSSSPLRRSTSPMTDRQVTLFPEPDSPTMPSVSPFSTREADPRDGLHDAVVRPEPRVEVLDFEHGHQDSRILGSRKA